MRRSFNLFCIKTTAFYIKTVVWQADFCVFRKFSGTFSYVHLISIETFSHSTRGLYLLKKPDKLSNRFRLARGLNGKIL